MKKILLLLPVFFLCISANAQKFIQIEDKAFNFGAKVGVNSTFPIVNSLTIDDVKAENIRLQYKVGYQASVFCRINIDRLSSRTCRGITRKETFFSPCHKIPSPT